MKEYQTILQAVLVGVGSLAVLGLIKKLLWRKLTSWAKQTSVEWDDILIQKLNAPVRLLLVAASISIGFQMAPDEVQAMSALNMGLKILFILLIVWLIDRILGVFVRHGIKNPNLTASTKSLIVSVMKLLLYSLFLLISLDTLGISITPILASLGVGSVAIALALQDTLSNLFSGIYIFLDKPISLDDYVKIDDTEGFVQKVGWRSTHVELTSGNVVIFPNTKVSSSVITNFYLPSKECNLTVNIGVGYNSDLNKVERIVLETANHVLANTLGAVRNFEPTVRFMNFGDSCIDCTVTLRALTALDRGLIRHEFIKAIHVNFKREGIDIPFPQRVVHLQNSI